MSPSFASSSSSSDPASTLAAGGPYPSINPTYIRLFKWEKAFDFNHWRRWMSDYWFACVTVIILYVFLIFKGQQWMKNRPKYELRGTLILWNICLVFFSIFAFRRTVPELYHLWFKVPTGFHDTVCSRNYFCMGTALWELIGIFSKVIELGDTAFIVLRKQPLIFLHWYHHLSVLAYTWYTYESFDPAHRLFMTMNYFVHICLYSYYAMKAMGIKISRKIAMVLTLLQLIQMVIGIVASGYSLWVIEMVGAGSCDRPLRNIYLALAMYISYLVLFSHFFYNAYMKKKSKAL